MNNNFLDEVEAPKGKKSIKNIPLPTRKKAKAKKHDDEADEPREHDEIAEEIIDLRKVPLTKHTHSSPSLSESNYDIDKTDDDDIESIKINDPYADLENDPYEDEKELPVNFGKGNKHSKKMKSSFGYYKFGATLLVILLIVIGIMSIFKSASITVYSKNQKIQNTEIIIPVENTLSNSSDTILDYKEINLESSSEINTKSDKEENVEEKSSGIITVYNEFSKTPQKLITNTRFETADGKIYRIQESMTVPGYTEKDGKKVAGSADVKVVADQAGDKFNIQSADFKIPGFKGQEQYDFFYAKTKTAISGGFVGIKKIIEPENLEVVKKELETRLKNNLQELVKTQISDDFIVINSSNNFTFSSPEQKEAKGDQVTMSMKGFAKYLVINKKDLSKAVSVSQNIDAKSDILVTNLANIDISLIEATESKMSLKLVGEFDLRWEIDELALKKDLAGKDKNDLGEITLKHGGIENINNIIIRPLWSSKFPSNPDKIKVVEMQ